MITLDQLEQLEPYIAGARVDDRGELEMYCPLHSDGARSMSINVLKGVWYCHAGCGGGSVRHLVLAADNWVPPSEQVTVISNASAPSTAAQTLPTRSDVLHWHRRLRRERGTARHLYKLRGISQRTIRRAWVGWDGRVFKVPVFSPRRRLWNVKHYNPVTNGKSKMWNTRGMGKARLYPVSILERAFEGNAVLLCEGEWDTLLALQHGYLAVTRTDGAGKPWHDEWTPRFAGLRVFLCGDRDHAGVRTDAATADTLASVADPYQVDLPFDVEEKGGGDLTDYLLSFRTSERSTALGKLMHNARRYT